MDLYPLHKWCIVNGIPSDIVIYIVCGFYEPVMKRYIGEKIAIMKMRDYLSNPDKCTAYLRPYRTSLLAHRLRILDTGIVDTRIGDYIIVINAMITQGVIVANEVLHVLEQGIREDNMLAFEVLYNTNMLVHFPCIDTFVRRMSEKYSALPAWQPKDIGCMTPLVKYHLDRQTDEPLLEWLTVWPRKGLNVCKYIASDLRGTQQVQMQFLCMKQQSPEMRQRRINSLCYNIYSDQVFSTI